ncbi:MAG: TatD family hydrolase [Coriobacteriia bacterium]|nr:TatD family hydrolase [Coriobacteriia bacterium]
MNIDDYTYDKYLSGDAELIDAHCHLQLMDHPERDFKCLSFGLLPIKYDEDNKIVKTALGYHPWFVFSDSSEDQLKSFKEQIDKTDLIGEIGLDFSPKHETTKDIQIEAFTEICKSIKNKTVSIHAVHASKEVLDILDETKAGKHNTIIMHWFTGNNEDLNRAIDNNYYFSCGPRMAHTKKGEAYIKQIPEEKLLIETDLPWDDKSITCEEHYNLLNDFMMSLRDIRWMQ